MARKRSIAEEIIGKRREAEVALGMTIACDDRPGSSGADREQYYGRDVPTVPLPFAAFLSCLACRFSFRVRDAACFVFLPPLSFVGISGSSLTVFVAPWHPYRVADPFQLPVPARPRLTCGAPKLHLL